MKLSLFLMLFLLGFGATAQKGWQYDKISGFEIKDTVAILKEGTKSLAVINGNNKTVGYLKFDKNLQLQSIFNLDTSYFFEKDSLLGIKKLTKVYGAFADKFPNIYGDSTLFYPTKNDTQIIITKKFFSGKSLNLHNDSLNKAYHRVKYDDSQTGEVLIPLKKKLKTNFEDEKIYIVKQSKTTITKGKKGKVVVANKYPLKRGYFEKPNYIVSKKVADIEEANETNRLYHKKIIFDKKGNITSFYFTDDPQNIYSILVNPPFELVK